MTETSYVTFDPDGDVELILKEPNAPFLVWPEDEGPPAPTRSADQEPPRMSFRGTDPAVPRVPSEDILVWGTTMRPEPEPTMYITLDLGLQAVEPELDELVQGEAVPEPAPEPAPEPEPAEPEPVQEVRAKDDESEEHFDNTGAPLPQLPEIRMRVSSRHLILASSNLRAALTKEFREASERVIEEEHWDADALKILMNIIHGRNRSVPKVVDLEILAKIAVLVDYYDCHEAVEPFSEPWIKQLRHEVPTIYGRDVVLWICVSYVFSKADLFQAATKTALRESRGPLYTAGLPIPASVTGRIDRCREQAVTRIFALLDDLLVYLRDTRTACSFECSSILLGGLTKMMQPNALLSRQPSDALSGYSIMATITAVRNIPSPVWTPNPSMYPDPVYGVLLEPHPCRISQFLEPIIDRLETTLVGLSLKNFKRMPEPSG